MESLTFYSNFPLCFSVYPSSIIKFHYLMDLHYSQTVTIADVDGLKFHYLMNLHYSQTVFFQIRRYYMVSLPYEFTLFSNTNPLTSFHISGFTTLWIYTILKQFSALNDNSRVLLPYGFTLFSNRTHCHSPPFYVLLPYGFTLFSNSVSICIDPFIVLLPYGFTLFSNLYASAVAARSVLLPYGFTLFSNAQLCPPHHRWVLLPYGFTLFSNFDFGGCKNGSVLLPYGFTLFSNWKPINDPFGRFYYLMDLHYSQTCSGRQIVF